jgi:cystathionine gamma-lyase
MYPRAARFAAPIGRGTGRLSRLFAAMSDRIPTDARFETLAIHAGQSFDPTNGAVMTPVYFNSTYAQPAPDQPHDGYDYSRSKNPTRTALEENLAALEGGSWGIGFASGMAAISAIVGRLEPGDHVVTGNDLYGGTYRVFTQVYARYGIEFTMVDATDANAVEAAFTDRTKLLFLETPTNPLLRLCDIADCAARAKKRGIEVAVDNTFATPYLQQPISLGADLVVHSLTKYLGGHSDVVGGAVIGASPESREGIWFLMNGSGAQFGPMDAFLVMRGTKTLALRMDRHSENAAAIAEFLSGRQEVEQVIYPGLPSHPQHELAKRQMRTGGGMVSFELKGGVPAGEAFASATRVFTLAESLGGVESLVETPPSMTHASIPVETRRAAGLADGLVRLSVGVENVEDLLADVEQALAASRNA